MFRRGEVAALDVGDVAPEFGSRRVKAKGGHEVPVVLPAPARAILREYLATERAGAPATTSLFVVKTLAVIATGDKRSIAMST